MRFPRLKRLYGGSARFMYERLLMSSGIRDATASCLDATLTWRRAEMMMMCVPRCDAHYERRAEMMCEPRCDASWNVQRLDSMRR